MLKTINRKALRIKRQRRIRKHVQGTLERPRLAVYRSNLHLSVQLIDDVQGITLAAASTQEAELKKEHPTGANIASAISLGKVIAKRAQEKGIQAIVFDRGGNLYHGRIKALADAAREGGLDF